MTKSLPLRNGFELHYMTLSDGHRAVYLSDGESNIIRAGDENEDVDFVIEFYRSLLPPAAFLDDKDRAKVLPAVIGFYNQILDVIELELNKHKS